MGKLDPLMSSETNEWFTPPEVLKAIAPLGPIALDPCGNPLSPVEAERRIIWPEADGLKADWHTLAVGGLVYINPPFGRRLRLWARKIQREAAAGAEIVLLVPARVDTSWWETLHPAAWCAWRRRIRFIRPDGRRNDPAPFPVALLYFGRRAALFAAHLRKHGRIYHCDDAPAPERQQALF